MSEIKKKKEKAKKHYCPKNCKGSIKGIEAHAALLLTQSLCEKGVCVQKVVADYDSLMKAVMRHSYEDKEMDKINSP
eukprot:1130877-Ditylum_brightwellii.AAC.1